MNHSTQSEWPRRLDALREEARSSTASALGRTPNLQRNANLNKRLGKLADEQIRQLLAPMQGVSDEERERMAPKCREGCSHCCYQWVRVSIPEVLAITEYIFSNCDEQQIASFRAAAEDYRKAWANVPKGTRPTIACPLLVNDRCAVYPVRPLIGRGVLSLDVQSCIERKEYPDRDVPIPIIGPVAQIAWSLKEGLQESLNDLELPAYDVVLGLAIRITLSDPDAGSRYLQGEDVFAE